MLPQSIIDQLAKVIAGLRRYIEAYQKFAPERPPIAPPDVFPLKETPPIQNAPQSPTAPFKWGTPDEARHSVRLICDEEGLTVDQKNIMSQVIHCESAYKIHALNKNIKDGRVVSADWGICQWNDYYHGKEISPDQAMNNPEKAVRLMCKYVKEGRLNQWVCYSKGYYKRYSA